MCAAEWKSAMALRSPERGRPGKPLLRASVRAPKAPAAAARSTAAACTVPPQSPGWKPETISRVRRPTASRYSRSAATSTCRVSSLTSGLVMPMPKSGRATPSRFFQPSSKSWAPPPTTWPTRMSSARAMCHISHAIEFRSSRGRTRICSSVRPAKVRSAADILLPPTAAVCMAACCSRNRSRVSMGPSPPCISQTAAGAKLSRVKAGGSPWPPGSRKTVSELGAPPTVPSSNPNSRLGRAASPHAQGRVMEPFFIGIDVAKDRLDVNVQPSGEAFTVTRDEVGLADLARRAAALAPLVIALEATGGYEVVVAATLAAAALPVVVVNPRQIRELARSTGRLSKTDALDARAIAAFAAAVRPAVRAVPDAQARLLGQLVARRRQLVDMLGAEQNRRRLIEPALKRRLDAHIRWLERAVHELE